MRFAGCCKPAPVWPRTLEFTSDSLEAGELTPVAHFDVDPGPDAPVFAGG